MSQYISNVVHFQEYNDKKIKNVDKTLKNHMVKGLKMSPAGIEPATTP